MIKQTKLYIKKKEKVKTNAKYLRIKFRSNELLLPFQNLGLQNEAVCKIY